MARSRISGNQLVDADVLSEEEHDSWVHRNLVCSGTITFTDEPSVLISGSGDVMCDATYVGDVKLSDDGSGGLHVNDQPIESSTSGYTGTISVITDFSELGVATKKYFVFEDGLLTTVSGNEQIELSGLSIL